LSTYGVNLWFDTTTSQFLYKDDAGQIQVFTGGGGGGGSGVSSVNGRTGVVTLSKSDVGLSAVNNTSDANKPVSTATQTALNLKADIASLGTIASSDLTVSTSTPTGGSDGDIWVRI
jgi:hypothetical protein